MSDRTLVGAPDPEPQPLWVHTTYGPSTWGTTHSAHTAVLVNHIAPVELTRPPFPPLWWWAS